MRQRFRNMSAAFIHCQISCSVNILECFFASHPFVSCSMSVTQAMEWLIEHVDDPTVDAPLPGQDSSGAAGATAAATPGPSASASASAAASGPNLLRSLSSQSSTDESSRQDELTEIFKRIRRKREFRPDSRVGDFIHLDRLYSTLAITFFSYTCLVEGRVALIYNDCSWPHLKFLIQYRVLQCIYIEIVDAS